MTTSAVLVAICAIFMTWVVTPGDDREDRQEGPGKAKRTPPEPYGGHLSTPTPRPARGRGTREGQAGHEGTSYGK